MSENAEKKTIQSKVDELNAEKNVLLGQLNTANDTEKVSLQDRINVIERKVRWYAGRTGEGKAVRPTKVKKEKATEPAPTPATEAPTSIES